MSLEQIAANEFLIRKSFRSRNLQSIARQAKLALSQFLAFSAPDTDFIFRLRFCGAVHVRLGRA